MSEARTLRQLIAPALASVFSILLLVGCGDTREDPVDGSYRFFHAAVTQGTASFLLEERPQGTLNFGGGNALAPLDSGPFDFHVETQVADSAAARRTVNLAANIVADQEHLFVLFDDGGTLQLVEYSRPAGTATGTDTQVQVLHADAVTPAVDVYVEADGADLLAATPRATVSFKEMSASVTFPAGEHRVSVTLPNDPATLLYQSSVVTLPEAGGVIIVLHSGSALTTGAIRASLLPDIGGTATLLNDSLSAPLMRTIHGASTAGPLDVVIDGDFALPQQAAVMAGEQTSYAALPAGESLLQVTPAGDSGVIEVEATLQTINASRRTQIITGTPGALVSTIYSDTNRGTTGRAKLHIRNAASAAGPVDVYLVEPGTDVTTVNANFVGVSPGGAEINVEFLPDDFELTLVADDGDSETENTTVVAGPIAVSLEDARVFYLLFLDSATPGMIDVTVSDETTP